VSKTKFTKKLIEDLEPKERRYNVLDSDTRGLGCVVHPSGQKVFYHVRKVQGWPQRVTLGAFPEMTLDDARGKASELNGKLSKWKSNDYEGPNPSTKPKRISTLGQVLDHYVEHHLKGNAKNPDHAIKYAKWQFDSYLASWRNRQLGTILREHVRELHAEIAKKHGDVTANRTLTFLRTLFYHAIHPDVALWVGVNPCAKPEKILATTPEESRDRTIKRDEAPQFFKALLNEPHRDLRDFILLALSTGQRRGAIFAMAWNQIDWEKRLWTIPARNRKGKKGRGGHIVPLTPVAFKVVKSRADMHEDWVFPGAKQDKHLVTIKKPWKRFLERAGLAEADLRVHDLRRSLATAEGDTGASTEAIKKTLGHAEDSKATEIYDRSDRQDEVRNAMSAALRDMLAAGKVSQKKLLAAPRD
jgi:integrase